MTRRVDEEHLARLARVPVPGPHGGDGVAVAKALGLAPEQILDLSATMNPLAPDLIGLAQRHLGALSCYPEPSEASAALSEAIGVSPARLVLCNGGAEAIGLVAGELEEAEIVEPEFSSWRRHLRVVRPGAGRVRSNPNNPRGELAQDGERASAWDEAFYALATGQWTRGDADQGAYVVGSLTKLFSCPGLRLGYVICPDEPSARALRKRQPLWPVNGLALALCSELVGLAALEEWAAELARLGEDLAGIFQRAGFCISRAEAPWILVHDAPWLRAELALSGVVVRDCTSFGLPGTQRVALCSPAGLERVEQALSRIKTTS